MGHAVDVDASTGNVGGDQVFQFAAFEFVQSRQAFFLRHIAGQALAGDTFFLQVFHQLVGSVSTIGKNNGAFRFNMMDEIQQDTSPLAALYQPEFLIHCVCGHALGLYHNVLGVDGP